MATILKNSDLYYGIVIRADGVGLLPTEVEKIEFSFDDLIKIYPTNNDIEAKENGLYLVRLTQQETRSFKNSNQVKVQIRVKRKDGRVVPSAICYTSLQEALSKEDL